MHLISHAVHWMQIIQAAGWTGYLMFIALYAACCVFFIPASFLTFAAGAVWGFWGGMALVLTGNGLGSVFCLLITRYLFHDWAEKHFRRNRKLRAVAEAAQHDGWKIVFLTRLSPVMPYSLINYALGLTNLSAWRFLAATEVGSIPATAIYIYLGTLMGSLATIRSDMHSHGPLRWALQGGGLIVTILVTIYVTHLASKALQKRIKASKP
jgi:uncharacterized membrane protein YdjX (TVP38/TMEM64 family)